MVQTITLPDGTTLPALGAGTWNMGDSAARREEEIASLRYGVEQGVQVVDTAEMYGNGRSEKLVGEAIAPMREQVFLVSKVLPTNASAKGVAQSCRRSLQHLGTDRLDLYLLHWRGSVPLAETVEAFRTLQREGLIRHWGVSNFDTDDMRDLERCAHGGECAVNQVLYSLEHRGVEYDLLQADRQRKVVTMAYSPIGQGGALLANPVLRRVAARHTTSLGGATPAQVALAWVLRQPNMLAIPKAGTLAHMRLNLAAAELELGPQDLAELDGAFAPPTRKQPLAMI
ncbi:aldo/keto reductase [Acetobacter lambici]|uniref:Aldo/keto reductase n=1 Tax=Acetobacter lambici TaxID=1332824 RepID=A0ABT1F0Z7_9PROT|nr:aldo/keto reductase [Acetobacter lambici]MCP1241922.1 aldo/keto reductase [Acetobacter lambici]MCP1257459.1 aldo/keto reductase [Acetobacter lambici]NHO56401.1 aldo/keto reductase [Acetobacter lambici]